MSTHSIKAILLAATTVLGMAGCAVIDRLSGESEARLIREHGHPASARVVAIHDTGITINDDPVVDFDLQVQPDQGEPYAATARSRISRLHIPIFQPGAVLPVSVDPAVPGRVALDVYETGK